MNRVSERVERRTRRNLPLIIVLLYALLAFKVIRMAPLPWLASIWNLHILALVAFGAFVLLYLNRFFVTALDRSIALLAIGFFTTAVVNGVTADVRFIAVYILPLVAYYFTRGLWFQRHEFDRLLFWLSVLLISTFIVDFVSSNFLNFPIIDYDRFRLYMATEGIRGEDFSDFKLHPLFGQKLLRIPGVALAPQPTAVLYASLAAYHIKMWQDEPARRASLGLGLVSAGVVVLANSGTGYLVLGALILFSARSLPLKVLAILAFPVVAAGSVVFYYGDQATEIIALIVSNVIDAYFGPLFRAQPGMLTAFLLGGGTGEDVPNWEINFLDILFAIGVVNSTLLIFVLVTYMRTYRRLRRLGENLGPQVLLVIGLILGSIHYDSLFRYPSSLLIFGLMGYASKQYLMLGSYHSVRITPSYVEARADWQR